MKFKKECKLREVTIGIGDNDQIYITKVFRESLRHPFPLPENFKEDTMYIVWAMYADGKAARRCYIYSGVDDDAYEINAFTSGDVTILKRFGDNIGTYHFEKNDQK